MRDRPCVAVRLRGEALLLLKTMLLPDSEMVAERAIRTHPRKAAQVLYAAQQAEARAAALRAFATAPDPETKRANKEDTS